MSGITWPLGGDVGQAWSWWLHQSMRQFGLINIEQTVTSDPELERRIVTEVAGYGKQLGRMMEALSAVLEHSENMKFTPNEKKALADFKSMAAAIADEKHRYGASVEDMLARVIDEAKEKKDSPTGRRLIDRMREAVETLDSGETHNGGARSLPTGAKRIVAARK